MAFDQDTCMRVYEQLLATGREWKIDGVKQRPSFEDVELMVNRMFEQVYKSPTPISIESGGILVKRTDEYIDVYVFAGGSK